MNMYICPNHETCVEKECSHKVSHERTIDCESYCKFCSIPCEKI